MDERYVETNGITLHVVDHPGDGPTLILMPGLTANARFFDALIGAGLAPALRVMAVDLRGRGLSDKPDHGYTMADHAADILGLVDDSGIDQAILGGHSFGGLLTYHMAAHHPDRVARCVVLDAPAEVDPTILEQIKPSLERLEAPAPSWDAYLEAVKAQPYFEGWWEPEIEAYYRADVEDLPDGRVRARSHPDHIRQAVEGTLVPDWPTVVGCIRLPTLLVRCTDPFGPPGYPPILPADAADRTVARMMDAQLVEVPGNHITAFFGHRAAALAAHIRTFVLG